MRRGSQRDDWRECKIGDLIESLSPGVSVSGEDCPAAAGQVGVLKTSAVTSGRFIPHANKVVVGDQQARLSTPVTAGTIIMCRSNSLEFIGASALVNKDHPSLYLSDKLWALKPRSGIRADWLACLLASLAVRSFLRETATGTSSSMKNVPQDRLLNITTFEPPFLEQRRIAEILRSWDDAIEKTERLIAAKQLRFKNHREEFAWCRRGNRVAQLSELLAQSSGRVGPERNLRVFSVTKDGLVPQDEHFNKRIANEDIFRHMVVEQGDFAFSGLNFWLGSVDVSLEPEPFCISPDYKVFKISQDVVPGFFRHLVRTDHFRQILRSCAVERASVVRKNFDRETFLASEIPLPDRGRQEAVLKVMSAAEHELLLLRLQLDALAKQKRGLMQKLLTGEWPVTVPVSQEAAE